MPNANLRRSGSPMRHRAVLHPLGSVIYRCTSTRSCPLSPGIQEARVGGGKDLEKVGVNPQHQTDDVTETEAFYAAIGLMTTAVEDTEGIDGTFRTRRGPDLSRGSVDRSANPGEPIRTPM